MENSVNLITEESRRMDAWLDMAEAMLSCGAEIRRVEKTLDRLSKDYRQSEINAFTINSYISITCTFLSGDILTQSRRIISNPSTDLELLEKLNSLSRQACAEHMGPAELKEKIRLLKAPAKKPFYYAGGFLAPFAFALFFGSTLPEAAISGLAGIFICFALKLLGRYMPNAVFSNFISALVTGLMIYSLCRAVPSLSPARILIGDVMLLIPGISLTNSTRDIMIGDTISGTMRFVESILWAGSLAIGFVAAILLLGGGI